MAKGRRQSLNFSTTKAGVSALGTVTTKFQLPFRFRIMYLYIKNMVGQAYNLQIRVFIGPRGSNQDQNVFFSGDNSVAYVAGDDDEVVLTDVDPTGEVDYFVTVEYYNADVANALTGKVIIKVEEVTD